ncbi:MAG: hypothetical protein IKS55_00985 [Oscillospiraceae bacterium]|nr:hypothetical protein [Oscillospiraceae bacterium]
MATAAEAFLIRYGMVNPAFDIQACAAKMCGEMERGLKGEHSSYPMIPTYLKTSGKVPEGEYVAVIDAGGTNFRSALAHFENGCCHVEQVKKIGMPGIEKPVSWEEFISFVADAVDPFMDRADKIGFCFSYSADITPEIDGRVNEIDKEVVITGCEGRLVGADLCRELARRGYSGKRAVIINDTAAVQLGGMAKHLNDGFVSCFGQVSGTGTNTCAAVPGRKIGKIEQAFDMIVNFECGSYEGLEQGLFDRELDENSHNPGKKHLEKMTAGVYLGELCHLALCRAVADGLLSEECGEKLRTLPVLTSAEADAFSCGKGMEDFTYRLQDAAFIKDLAGILFCRSARLMCANLIAMAELTDAGRDGPTAVFAEGSLVQHSHLYAPELRRLLKEHMQEELGRDVQLVIEEDSTLPGAAAAALLNLH